MFGILHGKTIDPDGNELWHKDGVLHREDGPAIIVNAEVFFPPCRGMPLKVRKGTTAWLLDGVLHRDNAPAVEYSNGMRAWWVHGKLHREDGPAVEYPEDSAEYKLFCGHSYWLNGAQTTRAEFERLFLARTCPETPQDLLPRPVPSGRAI